MESCVNCSNLNIHVAELQLDTAVLSALLHKEQEKISSQPTQIEKLEVLTQNLMRDNENKSSELESIKTTTTRFVSDRGNLGQTNMPDFQARVSEGLERPAVAAPEVIHTENCTIFSESTPPNNINYHLTKERAEDMHN